LEGRDPIFLRAEDVAVLLDSLAWQKQSGNSLWQAIEDRRLAGDRQGGGDAA